MHTLTQAAIQVIVDAVDGHTFKSRNEMADKIDVSAFTLSQICNKKRTRINSATREKLGKINGFEDAMAIQDALDEHTIHAPVIARLLKLVTDRLDSEVTGTALPSRGRLSDIVKIDTGRLLQFTNGTASLSTLELACLYTEMRPLMGDLEFDDCYELRVAPFIVHNFSCSKLTPSHFDSLNLQAQTQEIYSAPRADVDICMEVDGRLCFFREIDIEETTLTEQKNFKSYQGCGNLPSAEHLQFLAFLNEAQVKQTSSLGKDYLIYTREKLFGRAELNPKERTIRFTLKGAIPRVENLKALIEQANNSTESKGELKSISELREFMKDSTSTFTYVEPVVDGPIITCTYIVEKGELVEEKIIEFSDLDRLYQRV